MRVNINCQYCNKYYICTHPTRTKFLWFFRRTCVYLCGELCIGQVCLIQKKISRQKKLGLAYPQKVCVNCQLYNENWEQEWEQKEYSWCNKEGIDMLNDKESEKLGYCKYFIQKKTKKKEVKQKLN